MEKFLVDAGLQHLIQTFQDQNITIDLIKNINEELLREFIPLIGDRIRFMMALNSFITEQKSTETASTSSTEIVQEPNTTKKARIDVDTPVVLYVEDVNNGPALENYLPSETSTTLPTITNISEQFIKISSPVSSTAYCENFCEDLTNLKKLLEGDCVGRTILLKYTQQQKLDNRDRNCLCELIISHFFNNTEGRLNNQCLSKIADQIIKLFPTEQKPCYYVSPVRKRKSSLNRPEVARGKLVDKHRNKITALKKLSSQCQESVTNNRVVNEEVLQSTRDSKLWLTKNFEPKQDVIEHWKNSFSLRKLQSQISIEEFFNEWPVLTTQLAPELIDIDFQEVFKRDSNQVNIEESFALFFDKLLQIRRNNLSGSDETFLCLLKENITTDSKNAIKLFLIASLVPPKGRTRCLGKSQWKPSQSEARDGLFIHVKCAGDVEQAKKNRIDFMYRKGLTVQPYIIIIGSSMTNITSSFLIINDNTYNCPSVLAALDSCFKSHHVLDAKYSYECQHIWYLIQWHVYNLKTKNDIRIPFVEDIVM